MYFVVAGFEVARSLWLFSGSSGFILHSKTGRRVINGS